MKNILKKLHIMSNQPEGSEGSASSKSRRSTDVSSPERPSHSRSEHNKPFSAIAGWLNSVAHRNSSSNPQSSSNVKRGKKREDSSDSEGRSALDAALDAVRRDSGSTNNSRDPDIEEEYQIQLALELSAKEDPEAVQIEAVKQISLGSCPPENTAAEILAYRYWSYNALSYDDKVLDGFYDLYGIFLESSSLKMPSLVDLQGTPVSDNVSWEAVIINKAADTRLLQLEQAALEMADKSRFGSGSKLVKQLACHVSDNMGGPVGNPDSMLIAWKDLTSNLKNALQTMVLPLGSLTVGLSRHRALLFKVLADSAGIPCQLVKGQQYTGSDDMAMNFVKIEDGREYIVDLMADPGTLIPSDTTGLHTGYGEYFFSTSPLSKDSDSFHAASSSSGFTSSIEEHARYGTSEEKPRFSHSVVGRELDNRAQTSSRNSIQQVEDVEGLRKCSNELKNSSCVKKELASEIPSKSSHPLLHARSPSWTEGVSSPALRRMKVKNVSEYMIDAAKENPQLAQKLHNVLLESGVIAPANLFTEICSEQQDGLVMETPSPFEGMGKRKEKDDIHKTMGQDDLSRACFLPTLPHGGLHPKGSLCRQQTQIDLKEASGQHATSQCNSNPVMYRKSVPVAAAAAAAAAVVASTMVAAAKTSSDSNLELPVTAAATATAAAVVATTAAVGKQYENLETGGHLPSDGNNNFNPFFGARNGGEADATIQASQASAGQECDSLGTNLEDEKISDRSTGNDSSKSDTALDDVADCEILWEDIVLGERIGLGSYGEVYRGELHGTEVAVKKFLDQDITGESLEEFKSEVQIMKRLRHPNVVLFMGAVTRPPNLSIVTEFLPRGSLYRLLHRPNSQVDERRRMKMALDAARGMNYLHNCNPVIVHRDLKSPNLLVDKSWVVKVCDFGLSRMKHSTFLSSRSTAGTAEWMAPEVLRNEPSDEKCDVYSFGVILWELCTMKQPWGGMNPMQVVGAVGFQHRRLDIPDNMDPVVADIIRRCWQTDPKLRPSFAEIMAALKPLQRPVSSSQSQLPRPTMSVGDKGQGS